MEWMKLIKMDGMDEIFKMDEIDRIYPFFDLVYLTIQNGPKWTKQTVP